MVNEKHNGKNKASKSEKLFIGSVLVIVGFLGIGSGMGFGLMSIGGKMMEGQSTFYNISPFFSAVLSAVFLGTIVFGLYILYKTIRE